MSNAASNGMSETPSFDPALMKAVERLDYRVTVGDLAAQSGLNVNLSEPGLLALASEVGGHLQVAESGDVVYVFPKDFRDVLRRKYFRLQLQEWLNRVWRVLFYLIRISFGISLILLLLLVSAALVFLTIALNSKDGDSGDWGGDWGGDGGGIWVMPDFGWIFYSDVDRAPRRDPSSRSKLGFLEAVYSFLFGDGNPNADLEERRWQTIATVIRQNKGAVIAEQLAPYLDPENDRLDPEESYLLPVLMRFDGRPEVNEEGQLVYHFPSLQTTVQTSDQRRSQTAPPFLREAFWRFSQASSGQITAAIGLGVVLFCLSIWLNVWLAAAAGASTILGLIKGLGIAALGYSVLFLGIPIVRYVWLQWRNDQVRDRNKRRELRSRLLAKLSPALQRKLQFAQQFAVETVIDDRDLVYTTETDLTEQEHRRAAQIDAEWQKRLNGS